MPRLQVQPRGLFPDISFGREPSNSTGGTFTRVAPGFPGAHPKTGVDRPQIARIKQMGRGFPVIGRVLSTKHNGAVGGTFQPKRIRVIRGFNF